MAAGAVVRVAVVVGAAVAGIDQEENPFPDSRHRGMLKAAIQKVCLLSLQQKSHPVFRVGFLFIVFLLFHISVTTTLFFNMSRSIFWLA